MINYYLIDINGKELAFSDLPNRRIIAKKVNRSSLTGTTLTIIFGADIAKAKKHVEECENVLTFLKDGNIGSPEYDEEVRKAEARVRGALEKLYQAQGLE